MRVPAPYRVPVLAAAVLFSVFACESPNNPTSPGSNAADSLGGAVVVHLPDSSLAVGEAANAAVTDAAGQPLQSDSLEWSSSDTSVLAVSRSGVVTARSVGAATISATCRYDASGYVTCPYKGGTFTIKVTDGMPAKVVLSPASASPAVGAQVQLSAVVTAKSGRTLPSSYVRWSSTNPYYVTVSSTGVVTGVRRGSARVIATAFKVADTAIVNVGAASTGGVSTVSVSPGSVSLVAGRTQQLSAKLTDNTGHTVTGQTVTWSSSNAYVVSVSSSGMATASHTGSATVTATANGHSGRASFTVTAATPRLTSLTVSPSTVSLTSGKQQQFSVAGKWSDGSSKPPAVSFSAAGGTITSAGMYTAGTTAGTFKVIAKVTGGSMADTSIVTVAAAPVPPSSPTQPTAPVPPPTTAPAPPPIQTACSNLPHSRLVSVSNSSQLSSALSGARPGDLIEMADGSYGGQFKISVGGSASQPIALCGSSNAVISAGSVRSGSGLEINGANYWTIRGITVTNAMFGIWGQKSSHFTIENMTFHTIGQEAVEIFNFSKYLTVRNSKFYDLGAATAEYGEAIYIGSAYQKWSQFTGGQPDRSDSALVEGNTFGPNVRAEMVEGKEGTTGGIIRNNVFDGTGMIESQAGWPSSWVMIEGNKYHVTGNRGTNTIISGYRVTAVYSGNGMGNIFTGNTADVRGAKYGFAFDTPSSNGNIATCDNVVLNASIGFGNQACK
jgi:hypothetical protein